MDALIAFDKRSHWFVLVSPYKENRRGRRETTRGKATRRRRPNSGVRQRGGGGRTQG